MTRALALRLLPAHLLALVLVGIAVGLGVWQLNGWEARRTAEARDLTRVEPVAMPSVMGPDDPYPGDAVGQPVLVEGTWVPEGTVYVADREHEGRDGFWAVTPVAIGAADDPALLVVRGWTPDPTQAPAPPTGRAELVAWLQPPEGTSGVTDEDPGDDVLPQVRIADAIQHVDQDLYGAYAVVADRVAAIGPTPSPVEILVNNAGYGLATPFTETEVEAEEQLLDVLVRAVLVLSHAAVRSMSGRGRGQIINVSSVAGFITSGTYSAAKSYVTVFTESLSSQLSGTGVTATALCPGFVVTEFHQRAGIDRGERTGPLWLDAKDLVRTALADADRGRAVSIPSPQYKALVTVLRHVPRAIVRNPAVLAVHRRR